MYDKVLDVPQMSMTVPPPYMNGRGAFDSTQLEELWEN